MRSRACTIAILVACLAISTTSFAQNRNLEPRVKVYNGPLDLDGPSPGPQLPAPPPSRSSASRATTLAFYDFEGGGGAHDAGNWSTSDRLTTFTNAWHVDGTAAVGGVMTGGSLGTLLPIEGSKSMWCGAPSATGDYCRYVTAPGYGNNWDQILQSNAIGRPPGDITLTFWVAYDLEPNFDFMYVEFENEISQWERATLPSAGTTYYTGKEYPAFKETIVLPAASLPPGHVRIRFRVVSDNLGSDEDGLHTTDGAAIVDDVRLVDSLPFTFYAQSFELNSVGDNTSTDGVWVGQQLSRGSFAELYSGLSVLQQSPPVPASDVLSTCVWGFHEGSTDDYGCGGFPTEPAVPFGDEMLGYMNNDIRTPWIAWDPLPGETTHLEFDVYMDLPLDNLIMYEFFVRQRTDFGCPTQWRWNRTGYYSDRIVVNNPEYDISRFLSNGPGFDEIQISIAVVDLFPVSGPGGSGIEHGTGACHSNAPYVDNVHIFLENTHSWVVKDGDLFQDAFPTDETATGTIRADAACGEDEVRITVTEPGVGLDSEGNAPAVFCHVGTLPGKAGAIVSGGPQWPEIPSMSDANWTVLQLFPTGDPAEFSIDLNDALYVPGDVVRYYFSARDANGGTTYFSSFTGRVDFEKMAQINAMEFTALPSGKSNILYVDAFSSRGAEPYFRTSFEEMGVQPDRFDVRSPSSRCGNNLGLAVGSVGVQLIPFYDTIIWNTGDLGGVTLEPSDYQLLLDFIEDHSGGQVGVYLSGDDLASNWDASQNAAAGALRQYCNFTVTNQNHRDAGEPVSPTVVPAGGSPFTRTMIAYGGGQRMAEFDVLAPGQQSAIGMEYNPTNQPAIIYQSSANQNNSQVNVVLAGFSHHAIRDDSPQGVADRTQHLADVLNFTNNGSVVPNAVPDFVENSLGQNRPNPFNPITTIGYTIQRRGMVTLKVYDVAGRLVRTLVSEVQAPDATGFSVDWNGATDTGVPAATGVYFYKLEVPGFTQTKKMVLLK